MDASDEKRLAAVQSVWERFGLPESLWAVLEANPARELPYHGQQHLYTVALLAVEGAAYYNFPGRLVRQLFLAGLFHDYGYVAGDSEEKNIGQAVIAARASVDTWDAYTVETLIRATHYPHPPAEGLLQSIIQDADTLQLTAEDFPRFLLALEEETGKPADPLFPGEGSLNTKWGKMRYNATIAPRAKEDTHA